ncbi:MAG: hypothetical protein AAGA95_16970 [Pseudomonadota bacterium]
MIAQYVFLGVLTLSAAGLLFLLVRRFGSMSGIRKALLLVGLLAALRVGIAFLGDSATYAEQLQRAHAGGREAPEFDAGNAWGCPHSKWM